MTPNLPRALVEIAYEQAARDYQRKLPPEHYMEATAQATQREITLESLALVKARRPDVHVFNELLVQYPLRRRRKPGQVVPDNMVVLHPEPITAGTSFNVPLQPAKPFWVLEYVSKNNKRKDYEDNFRKYEQGLQVPYYLLFYPDIQELTLYRYEDTKYVTTLPNEHGRYPVLELKLEVGLLEGWVRFWYQGRLLPLPADLQRQLEAAEQRADELERRLAAEQEVREALERELAQLRAPRSPQAD
jgi:Uma2 family endonuclease